MLLSCFNEIKQFLNAENLKFIKIKIKKPILFIKNICDEWFLVFRC